MILAGRVEPTMMELSTTRHARIPANENLEGVARKSGLYYIL
jgi:hypothetical protein